MTSWPDQIFHQILLKHYYKSTSGGSNMLKTFDSSNIQPQRITEAEPILPISRKRKPWNPKGATLLSKRFSFSFVFLSWSAVMKTWMINYFNAVPCHPLYVKRQSNHVTYMGEKRTRTVEDILFLEHFPWAQFKMEWNANKCVSSILHPFFQPNHHPYPPTQFYAGPSKA